MDETVYHMCDVPVDIPGAIDTCLLILHDWSNDLTLDPVEIDKERGVVHEEWRTRMTAMLRFQEQMLPIMYAGSKYGVSLPIGKMDIIMNFEPQTLRDYYEKWYRPDLQAIIVVGDIDVDSIEAQIKNCLPIFPPSPMPPNENISLFTIIRTLSYSSRKIKKRQTLNSLYLINMTPLLTVLKLFRLSEKGLRNAGNQSHARTTVVRTFANCASPIQ